MLKIYNSLTRSEDTFVPLDPPRVRMYVCGITVYDYCHLGHARMLVVFDMIQRWLRAKNFDLTYVRNITDIDDKIIRRASENGESVAQLTQRFIQAMDEDAEALGIQKPDIEPRATDHISEMLDLIRRLEERGLAYQSESGDVNFSVRKFSGYGKLSGKSLADLRAGERVEVDASKEDPLDFVLWKRAKEGEPFWKSRWGNGRPGWHIECSAMSTKFLGMHFDIHGGGQDLQFPHHENEIAQSEGALGADVRAPFVRYWIHNGFVRMQEQKMSKSTGTFVTVRELRTRYDPEVVRFFVLHAHYRSPLNYSDENLNEARQALTRLYTSLKGMPTDSGEPDWREEHGRRFGEAMDADFNTPAALAILYDLANEVNRARSTAAARQLRALGRVLGLLDRESEEFLQAAGRDAAAQGGGPSNAEISGLIAERNEARKRGDFQRADDIRADLMRDGILLEDTPQGTSWRRA